MDDPYTYENRCIIEAVFPQIRNAYDLPMDEFLDRLEQAYEAESRRRGDDSDPLNAQLKLMNKKVKSWAKKRKFA